MRNLPTNDPGALRLAELERHRLAFYWSLLEQWWWKILLCSAAAALIALTVSATLMPQSFCAEAAIKPLPTQNNLTEITMFQHLSSALGQNIAEQAKEYVAMLQSFTFVKWVVRHNPAVYAMLFTPAELMSLRSRPGSEVEWKAYRRISRYLTSYYDNTGGLLRLRYVAQDRATALKMLTILVDDLIANVRDRDIASYSAQIKSLQDHANRTSDELLRADIYEIIAKRMEQLTTAEASALTTFRIIEEPYVPAEPYQPRPFLYAGVSALTMPILLFGLIVMFERSRNFIREQTGDRKPLANGLDHTDSALKASLATPDPSRPN